MVLIIFLVVFTFINFKLLKWIKEIEQTQNVCYEDGIYITIPIKKTISTYELEKIRKNLNSKKSKF